MADSGYGVVRGGSPPNYNEGSTAQIAINSRGEQLTANGLPSKTELVSMGNSWNMMIPTGSAFTNVANMPTTRAELMLYNGEPGDGYSYVIDQITFLSLTSITALSNVALVWQLGTVAALTDDANILINSPTNDTYGGRAVKDLAVTTMTANKWCVCAAATQAATASIGFGVVADINGGIIVSPGATLGLNSVAGTAAGTSLIGVSWHEVKLSQA